MTEITPEAVKAARDAATPGPWDCDYHGIGDCLGDVWQGMDVRICEDATADDARLIAMTPDLATAYLAQAEEIERLRKRVEAADRLATACEAMTCSNWHLFWLSDVPSALAAYRATEGRG
jgi:hypothetical protein